MYDEVRVEEKWFNLCQDGRCTSCVQRRRILSGTQSTRFISQMRCSCCACAMATVGRAMIVRLLHSLNKGRNKMKALLPDSLFTSFCHMKNVTQKHHVINNFSPLQGFRYVVDIHICIISNFYWFMRGIILFFTVAPNGHWWIKLTIFFCVHKLYFLTTIKQC